MFREILPNCVPSILTKMTLDLGFVILIASSLSFLGLGVQPPTPDLGSMVADGAKYLPDSWWLTVFPAWPSCSPCSASTWSATGCARSSEAEQ